MKTQDIHERRTFAQTKKTLTDALAVGTGACDRERNGEKTRRAQQSEKAKLHPSHKSAIAP